VLGFAAEVGMSLEKALTELANKQKMYSEFCAYQMMLNAMPEKDRKALDEAWAKGYSANIVVKALRQEGYKATAESIRNHQRGMCRCQK
jgi:hypothetical protein